MENWKKTILNEYQRLSPENKFKFSCHRGLTCFGKCCGDVNVFLTPYDVLRMKKALAIPSGEFLEKYTLPLILQDQQLPVALLKMGDDSLKKCPFVIADGCAIYPDRPWACRMYPLGLASSKPSGGDQEFCFIADEKSLCLGFQEDREWSVKEWMSDQEVDNYNKKSAAYMQLTMHKHFQEGKSPVPSKAQMFYTALYDLDRFRRDLFESTFFNRFDVEPETIEKIRTDDEALLDFGIRWLRFSLFGESTLKIKDEVVERKKGELGLDSVEEGEM
ncbi:YkgJ family cysteine cluster protein [Chloroflexota bacterium]